MNATIRAHNMIELLEGPGGDPGEGKRPFGDAARQGSGAGDRRKTGAFQLYTEQVGAIAEDPGFAASLPEELRESLTGMATKLDAAMAANKRRLELLTNASKHIVNRITEAAREAAGPGSAIRSRWIHDRPSVGRPRRHEPRDLIPRKAPMGRQKAARRHRVSSPERKARPMSLFNALSTAVSSVSSLNAAVRVVSDNVANSTNEDYNRRIARFENLQFGGVKLADISRAANEGLQRDLFQQTTIAAGDETRDKLYIQMEQLVGTINGQTPLVDDFERLRSAFKALEATPESDAAENDTRIAALSLEKEFTRLSDGLDLIENQVLADIPSLVTTINETLVEIDRLNAAVAVELSNGRPTAALENSRDAQIEELAKFTQVRTFDRDDGSKGVYTTTGLVLVDSNPETFTWSASSQTLTLSGSTATNLVTSGQLPDGQLAALTNFIRTDSAALASAANGDAPIEKMRNQLDELAFSLADDSTARASGTTFVKNNTDLTTSGVVTAGNTLTFTIGGTLLGTVTVNAGDSIDTVVDRDRRRPPDASAGRRVRSFASPEQRGRLHDWRHRGDRVWSDDRGGRGRRHRYILLRL
jgi:flagellar hook-associated protein FlgK